MIFRIKEIEVEKFLDIDPPKKMIGIQNLEKNISVQKYNYNHTVRTAFGQNIYIYIDNCMSY